MYVALVLITLIICATILIYKYMDVIAETGKPPINIKFKKKEN